VNIKHSSIFTISLLSSATSLFAQQQEPMQNPYLLLMQKAAAHAKQHGAKVPPVLSPVDRQVVPDGAAPQDAPLVPVKELQAIGVRVIPWTTNDPEKMRAIIRTGVDGLITDRPDLLQQVLKEERANGTDADRARLVANVPMGRFVAPDEIAALALWLASPACSFSTGATFDISGGRATY